MPWIAPAGGCRAGGRSSLRLAGRGDSVSITQKEIFRAPRNFAKSSGSPPTTPRAGSSERDFSHVRAVAVPAAAQRQHMAPGGSTRHAGDGRGARAEHRRRNPCPGSAATPRPVAQRRAAAAARRRVVDSDPGQPSRWLQVGEPRTVMNWERACSDDAIMIVLVQVSESGHRDRDWQWHCQPETRDCGRASDCRPLSSARLAGARAMLRLAT